jgi:hypothetical protein
MQQYDHEVFILSEIDNYVKQNTDINAFLVQLIEHAGGYLNIQTIPDYAKDANMSYNGVKNNREIKEIFNIKFVIDNQ